MNHSFYSIDRTTHAKIVALALVAATTLAGTAIAVRFHDGNGEERAQHLTVIKAGKPAIVASRVEVALR
jgi:hypothetical protein